MMIIIYIMVVPPVSVVSVSRFAVLPFCRFGMMLVLLCFPLFVFAFSQSTVSTTMFSVSQMTRSSGKSACQGKPHIGPSNTTITTNHNNNNTDTNNARQCSITVRPRMQAAGLQRRELYLRMIWYVCSSASSII